MSQTFVIKTGATGPAFQGKCKAPDGTYVNLTGITSAKLRVRHENGTLLVNDATMTVVDAPNGEVSYSWGSTDTATPGRARAEVEIVFSGGEKQVYPSRGHIDVIINDRV